MLDFIIFFIIAGGASYCLIRFTDLHKYFIISLLLVVGYFTFFNRWEAFLSPVVLSKIAYFGTILGSIVGSLYGVKYLDNAK